MSKTYLDWKNGFLSAHKGKTRQIYSWALKLLEDYCYENGIDPLAISREEADTFGSKYAVANTRRETSARSAVSSCAAFYGWLVKQGAISFSPLARSKKPLRQIVSAVYPSKRELEAALEAARGYDVVGYLAVVFMAYEGMEASELKTVNVDGASFEWTSRGEKYTRELSATSLKALEGRQGQVFAELTYPKLIYRLKKITVPTADGTGNVSYNASAYRNRYIVDLYERTKNVYAVQEALHYSNVITADAVLKGLGLINA